MAYCVWEGIEPGAADWPYSSWSIECCSHTTVEFIFVSSCSWKSMLADHCATPPGLRLSPDGYLTGDFNLDMPPMRCVLIDPYTGWDIHTLCMYMYIGNSSHVNHMTLYCVHTCTCTCTFHVHVHRVLVLACMYNYVFMYTYTCISWSWGLCCFFSLCSEHYSSLEIPLSSTTIYTSSFLQWLMILELGSFLAWVSTSNYTPNLCVWKSFMCQTFLFRLGEYFCSTA